MPPTYRSYATSSVDAGKLSSAASPPAPNAGTVTSDNAQHTPNRPDREVLISPPKQATLKCGGPYVLQDRRVGDRRPRQEPILLAQSRVKEMKFAFIRAGSR